MRVHETLGAEAMAAPPAGGGNPLLVLHGGPGLSHDYLEDLAILADTGRPVVFYERAG